MVSIEPVSGSDDDSSSVDSDEEVMAAVKDFKKNKSSEQRQQRGEISNRRLDSADVASSSDSEESSESADGDDEENQPSEEELEEQEEQEEENTAGFRQSLSLQERLQKKESQENMALKASRERRASAKKRAREILLQSRTKSGRKRDEKNLESKKKSCSKVRSEEEESSGSSSSDDEEEQKKRKRSKHAPAEVSSRRGRQHMRSLNESGIGVEIGARRYQPRDPRMSSLTGHFDSNHFEHHYGFLDGMRDKEMKVSQEKLKALKQTGRRGQRLRRKLGCVTSGKQDKREQQRALLEQLTQWKQQKAFQKQQRLERDAKHAVKEKLRQNVANNGSSAIYYPKRKEMRQLQQEAKLEQLRKGGGEGAVEKYLTKKRKKQKSQDSSRLRL